MSLGEEDVEDRWYTVYVRGIFLKLIDAAIDATSATATVGEKDNDVEYVQLEMDIKQLNSKGIILDSGTTDTYLPAFLEEEFERAYKQLYGLSFHDVIMNYITRVILIFMSYQLLLSNYKRRHKVLKMIQQNTNHYLTLN